MLCAPDRAVDVPVQCRGIGPDGLWASLTAQRILWFCCLYPQREEIAAKPTKYCPKTFHPPRVHRQFLYLFCLCIVPIRARRGGRDVKECREVVPHTHPWQPKTEKRVLKEAGQSLPRAGCVISKGKIKTRIGWKREGKGITAAKWVAVLFTWNIGKKGQHSFLRAELDGFLPCQAHCSCSLSASSVVWGPAPAGSVCTLLTFVLWGWWTESLKAAYEFSCNIKPFLKGCKRVGLLRKNLVNVYCSVFIFLLLLFCANIFVIVIFLGHIPQ